MKKLEISFEILTPMFIAGAESRGTPELRAASVRGCLHYWTRAWLGGQMGLAATRSQEWDLLGGIAEQEENIRSSQLRVRLKHGDLKSKTFEREGINPNGRNYLYWSMAHSGRVERQNFTPPKQYFTQGNKFECSLSLRGLHDIEDVRKLEGIAWLVSHFGAIGSRASRTAGGFVATREPDTVVTADLQFVPAQDAIQYQKQLAAGLGVLRKDQSFDPAPAGMTDSDVLHPRHCRIWVLNGPGGEHLEPGELPGAWETADAAVQSIGLHMLAFRSKMPPDSSNVHTWLSSGRVPITETVERAQFGLPLPFRFINGGPDDVLEGTTVDRRRSPLLLRVQRLASGRFVGIAVLFKSRFFADNQNLKFHKLRAPLRPPGSYDLVERFVTEEFSALEVRYQ